MAESIEQFDFEKIPKVDLSKLVSLKSQSDWNAFVSTELQLFRDAISTEIGGPKPCRLEGAAHSDEEGDEYTAGLELGRAFLDFQSHMDDDLDVDDVVLKRAEATECVDYDVEPLNDSGLVISPGKQLEYDSFTAPTEDGLFSSSQIIGQESIDLKTETPFNLNWQSPLIVAGMRSEKATTLITSFTSSR